MSAPIVQSSLAEHAREAVSLYAIRTVIVSASRATLHALNRLDERLVAHLDGLSVASVGELFLGETGAELSNAAWMFAAAVQAIECRDQGRLGALVSRCHGSAEAQDAVIAGLGWLEKAHLQGVVTALLAAQEPLTRTLGIAVCAAHGVDPGLASARRLEDAHPLPRARAFRAAGELGRRELLATCTTALQDEDPDCQFWAAWSAVLLGDRSTALRALTATGVTPGPRRSRAFRLALQAMSTSAAHGLLQELVGDPEELRWLIEGSGLVGDPAYVRWLIGHMQVPEMARLAGDAFSLITGVDLGQAGLERQPPDRFESGPNDDPGDPNVEMDPDEGLPWPDLEGIRGWWAANGSRLQAGVRYFMGAPVTREHCIDVLKNGYQRQRIHAAQYLCLLEPGTPLFNTSAPAWRQQKLLAQMG